MPHLSPTTLTTDEQRLILRATAGNVLDHFIFSMAIGTGLRLAEIVGLDVGRRVRAGLAGGQAEAVREVEAGPRRGSLP